MKENRFGKLLRNLLNMAEIQSQTLAVFLNYDTSYISKWINGAQVPAERSIQEVCDLISQCMVEQMTPSGRDQLFDEYQVFDQASLKRAIFDHLILEYEYFKKISQSKDNIIAGKTSFFPELSLTEYISKMKHPALRSVRSLQVVAVMDILELDKAYQLAIAEYDSAHTVMDVFFPGVYFSLVINLDYRERENPAHVVFLMNLLANLSNHHFSLYADTAAAGKLIFAVKDAYCISGMLFNSSHCVAVTMSEDENICQILYNRSEALCSSENLLVKRTSIKDMLMGTDYLQSILKNGLRLLIGHATELHLPEDLFEEVLEEWEGDKESLRRVHRVTQGVLQERSIKVIIHESVFSDFSVSGKIDFFGEVLELTYDQRRRCLQYMMDLVNQNPGHQIKIIHGGFITDYKDIPNPTAFLSNTFGLLRLGGISKKKTVNIINKDFLLEMFVGFFDTIWKDEKMTENGDSLSQMIEHAKESIEILEYRFQE